MKIARSLAFLLLPVIAVAQSTTTPPAPPSIPSHVVVGDFTIDSKDTQVPTAYGPVETRAAISVCTPNRYDSTSISIQSSDGTNMTGEQQTILFKVVNGAYCGTIVSQFATKSITQIQFGSYKNTTVSGSNN